MSKCLLGIYKLTGTRKGRGGESQRGDNTATAAASRPPFINQLYMLVNVLYSTLLSPCCP